MDLLDEIIIYNACLVLLILQSYSLGHASIEGTINKVQFYPREG